MSEERHPLDDRIDALVRAAVAAAGEARAAHPDPDELVDHCLKRLAPDAEARLRDHLAVCAECTQAVLDLEEIAVAPGAGAGGDAGADASANAGAERADAATVRQWQEFAERLGRSARPPRRPGRGGAAHGMAWALAASVLVCLGLLAWDLSLRRGAVRHEPPRADLQLVDLAPLGHGASERGGGGAEGGEVVVQPGVRRLVLRLDLGDLASFPRYAITLLGPGARPLWRDPDAHPGEDGAFLVEIAPRTLDGRGPFHLHLEGESAGGAARLLADYAVSLRR